MRSGPTLMALGAAAIAVTIGGCGDSDSSTRQSAAGAPAAALAPIHGAYSPKIDPAGFSATIDNRYLPFEPGSSWHFEGVAEDGKTPETDDVTVTRQTKRILGVDCVVVLDIVRDDGQPQERTFDWYAQDDRGNVWYFGEDSSDYKHGRWARNGGSWEGGVDGAKPGIVMPAKLAPGDEYRQEYYRGHAEDEARVVTTGQTRAVEAGSYHGVVVTHEFSPLEPSVLEEKAYAPGVGEISERALKGEKAVLELISMRG
jgi:hypothetical protein